MQIRSESPQTPPGQAVVLRGHHLLCQFGFRGYGYSPAFVENMRNILAFLREHPETMVECVDGPDSLCAAYPAEEPNHCLEPSVIARDRAVLSQLATTAGTRQPWARLVEAAAHAYVAEDLTTLCATCEWLPLGYCQMGLKQFKAGKHSRSAPP